MLTVHTARISYGGPDRIDITRMGNHRAPGPGACLAPSWELLRAGKNATRHALSFRKAGNEARAEAMLLGAWGRYERAYRAEMRQSYRHQHAAWERLLARERAVLVCYCTDVGWCHRSLAARYLVACGARYAGELA